MHIFRFIKSVISEMKLVTWPTAKETRHDTIAVIIITILFVIFFALINWILNKLLGFFTI